MPHLSPQVGELLLKATHSQDLDEALHKVLRDYLDLKFSALSAEISRLEAKWGCTFVEFKEKNKHDYTYEVEKTFWEWDGKSRDPGRKRSGVLTDAGAE